ncbi:hypothetical protein [Paraburkholderia atlantica]|uniref:hypothetical protein n=1 Tax=Paraburkholderia atlantica TaxID=2654982 RepID=UPI001C8583AF|nr:hypothetical protein [Paraburkholderia atlantica]
MKPMLRIVNMQRRLRPVYPGFDATDFAMDLRDLRRLDTPADGPCRQIAENFEIYLQFAFKRAVAILQFLPATLDARELTDSIRRASLNLRRYCRTVFENKGLQSVSRL